MRILKTEENDLRQILALQYLAWQSEARLINNFNIQPLKQTLEELEQEFRRGVILKALDENGEIVGSVRGRTDRQTLYIGKLMVHPDHRRKGLASLLLGEIERLCFMPRCELFTSAKSPGNIRLYQKNGYKIFREDHSSPDISFVYMEKQNAANSL